tara:strand:- start:545 stop:1471 length:927 start_codon:yes stop_codon:yes gene_type:complete
MTPSFVERLLDHYGFDSRQGVDSDVRILGGEPTQHSNFTGVIDAVIKRRLKVNLVSNLLFGEGIKNYIVKNIRAFRWMLPNCAELDEKNRLKTWKKNYLALYAAYESTWGFEGNSRLYLSLTISRDFKERNHFEYIKWLVGQVHHRVNAIRIGLDLTGTYLINNKELGKELTKILRFGEANNISIVSDCQVPPCLWEGETYESVMANSRGFATFNVRKNETTCGFLPIDIFPDGTSTQCYPLKGTVNVNDVFEVRGESKRKSLEDSYEKKYVDNYKRYDIPHECAVCVFYKNGCNGICAGCLNGEQNE